MTKNNSHESRPHVHLRERWATRIGLILAMAGNAVGLGNFLRFPVKCAQNGGGAFMIPYFLALFFLGIPLMWVEWGVGRFGGKYGHGTTPGMFHFLWDNRLAKYIGAIGIIIPTALMFYYTYIVSWTLGYSVFSVFKGYFQVPNHEGMMEFLAAFQGRVKNQYFTNLLPAYIFFGITVLLNIWILSKGLVKGIEALAKIALPMLFLFAVVLVIRVFTLGVPDPAYPENNVLNGLAYIWNPNFKELTSSRVWFEAAGQIFFTLSLGFGAIQCYASYLSTREEVVLNGLSTVGTNEFAEVILGGSIAIPVVVAFFGVTGAQEVAQGGAFDLGFLGMPLIFQRMPMGQFFGTLWFLLLFFAGLTSTVAMAQPLMSFLQEEFKVKRRTAAITIGGLVFFLSQPVILFLKNGFLDEMDFWIGTVALVVFAFCEIVIFFWVYGSHRAWLEICRGRDMKIPHFFYYIIKYVTPTYLLVLLIFWSVQNGIPVLLMKDVAPENAGYIWFARFLLIGIALFILFLVRIAWQRKHYIRHEKHRIEVAR